MTHPSTSPRPGTARRAVLAAAAWGALALGAGTWLATPAHAQAARYDIDPDHLAVGFLVDHIGYAKVLGMFGA